MTTRDERNSAKANRDDWTAKTAAAGHDMTWKLAPNATRKGYAYYFEGTCGNCGGGMSIGADWSSSHSVVDVRHVPCGGPGTYVLTEIEQARASELVADAVAEFGRALQGVVSAPDVEEAAVATEEPPAGPYPTEAEVLKARDDLHIADQVQLIGAMYAALRALATEHAGHGAGCSGCRTIRLALAEYRAWQGRYR